MKTTYLLILILTFSFNSKSQNISDFYYEIYQADQFVEKGELTTALLTYESAFKKVKYVHTKILKKALSVAKMNHNKILMNKYNVLIKEQKKCPEENKYILEKVDSIFKVDQMIRNKKKFGMAHQYYNKFVNDNAHNKSKKIKKAQYLRNLYYETDASNIKYMLSLIKKHGFIGEEVIGYNNYIMSRTILLHFDTDTNNVVLTPILDFALKNNQISPFRYAVIIDRHLYNISKTQKYYTWPMIDSDPQFSQDDIKEIIRLREGIGLWGTELKAYAIKGNWRLNNLSGTTY